MSQPGFYAHQWAAGDLRGVDVLFITVLSAGALADGGEILALATTPFSVQ